MSKIIGLVGRIGAGKDTAADYLVNSHHFRRDSFASVLKDAVSVIFGWDRTLLEGRTAQSREWRECVDPWWSNRLNIPHLTPRWVLQYWGTEVCRTSFHNDIWIASLENRLRQTSDNIVVSDVRFPNEIAAIRSAGGTVIRVKRGEDPEWFEYAASVNRGPNGNITWALSKQRLAQYNVHPSECAWVGGDIDYVVENNGTIDDFYVNLGNILHEIDAKRS